MTRKLFVKQLVVFLSLIYSVSGSAQLARSNLDDMMKETSELLTKGEFLEAVTKTKYHLLQTKLEDTVAQIYLNDRAAASYFYLADFESTISHATTALRLCIVTGNSDYEFKAYQKIGAAHVELKNTNKALDYLYKADELKSCCPSYIAALYNSFGIAYAQKAKPDSTLYYLLLTLNLDKIDTSLDVNNLALSYSNIGAAFIDKNDLERAKIYLDSVYTLDTSQVSNRILFLVEKNLFDIAYRTKNLEVAGIHFDRYVKLKESTLSSRLNSRVEELERVFKNNEMLLKEQIKLKNKENRLQSTVFITLVIALLILFALMVYAYLLTRRKSILEKESMESEQRVLRSQMNPHFIFNTISGIQTYIAENNNQVAIRYLNKFSKLLRKVLENSNEKLILLESEMETLEHYVDLQLMRFEHSFQFQIDVDEYVDLSNLYVPPLVFQPFVENAIEHGVRGIQDARINIKVWFKNDDLMATIDDNGRGMKNQKFGTKKSMATDITRKRLEIASKNLHKTMHLQVESKPSGGVTVYLTIPYLYQ